jgi:hypothetical protein
VNFTLHPFTIDSFPTGFQISGTVTRSRGSLLISYELRGNLTKILLPERVQSPERKNNLWQATCFEFFVASTDSSCYWEINLSPSGDWNVYAFDDCRAGMRQETAFTSLPFKIERQSASILLELAFPLDTIIRPEQSVELAVSAVLQGSSSQFGYWALTHCGLTPDFHRRESLLLKLPAYGPAVNFSACV